MRRYSVLLHLALLPSLLTTASVPSAWAQWRVNGAPLCTAASTQAYPRIISDGAGGAIVTWLDLREVVAEDIYAQHVLASGAADPAWPADGRAICTAPNEQSNPEIASDGSGGAIVTWQDIRAAGNYNIYAQRVLASGAVDPAWPADGRALCTALGDQAFPQIVSDGSGGAIVTWLDVRAGAPNYDIYAQHVLASGVVDPAWPLDGRALCTATNSQELPRIARDGAGGAIVVWADYRSGSEYDIYAQHVLSSGAVDPAWPTDGRAVCTASLLQISPALVADGTGGAIVTWHDFRGGVDSDIYAQHVLASGSVDPGWPANGRAVCTATNHQRLPQIVADGTGGAIVAWQDSRGVGFDIYAQHIKASGAVDPVWPVDGRGLCTATNNQVLVQIVADGSGGVIGAWQDLRNGTNYDVFAQHVLGSGAVDPMWPVDGAALCGAANDQDAPVVAADGAGGVVVAWYDFRAESSDIYVSRAYASGAVAGVPGSPTATGLRLAAPYPDPVRGETVRIALDLPSRTSVSAQIFDSMGRRVRSLPPEGELPAGHRTLEWDGRNDLHRRVPPGIYFIEVRAGGFTAGRRVVLLD
ncbi:MAG: FlgD immunoglobulin-like domain containing protein [Candidatus Eisenbacteria bacterium]